MRYKIWLQAARPKTLIASISPVLIGTTFAVKEGFFSFPIFLSTLFTCLGIQIGTNLANDYYDYLKGADTATRKGPQRVTQSGLVTPQETKRAFILTFILTACLSIPLIALGGWTIAILLALSIALGILYTAGPYPLGYLGLGELLVLLFFGLIAVEGTYYLQTGLFCSKAFLAGLAPGALSSAILTANNLRDKEEDALAEKKTLIVRFGKRFGQLEYTFFVLLPLLSTPWIAKYPLEYLPLVAFVPTLPLLRAVWTYEDPRSLNGVLHRTARLLILYTLLFCLSYLLTPVI